MRRLANLPVKCRHCVRAMGIPRIICLAFHLIVSFILSSIDFEPFALYHRLAKSSYIALHIQLLGFRSYIAHSLTRVSFGVPTHRKTSFDVSCSSWRPRKRWSGRTPWATEKLRLDPISLPGYKLSSVTTVTVARRLPLARTSSAILDSTTTRVLASPGFDVEHESFEYANAGHDDDASTVAVLLTRTTRITRTTRTATGLPWTISWN